MNHGIYTLSLVNNIIIQNNDAFHPLGLERDKRMIVFYWNGINKITYYWKMKDADKLS